MPPSLPAEREQLAQAAESLGLALPGEALDGLLAYRDLLQRWNRVYNLTAVREPADMLTQHLLDCLAIVPSLMRELQPLAESTPARILDVGSGGGLPGIVLAIVRPQWQVTCVDAVAKKTAFIRQAGAELGLRNVQAVHARIEAMASPECTEGYDLVTSRAFASLADFTRLTRHLIEPGGLWAAMKGQPPGEELAQLGPEVQLFHVEPLTVPGLAAQRCLVWLKPSNPP